MKEKGFEIIIITARDSEFHIDPFNQSKSWLEKNNIYYDKLIVNARDKASVCLKEKIDYLIDDSEYNCKFVNEAGIKTIKIISEKDIKFSDEYNDWEDIYKKIFNDNKEGIETIETNLDEYIGSKIYGHISVPVLKSLLSENATDKLMLIIKNRRNANRPKQLLKVRDDFNINISDKWGK